MRQFQLQRCGGGLDLVATEVSDPVPGAGEVVVRVRACSLNHRDLLMRSGGSASGGGEGLVPVSDGAGEVVEVGAGVTGVEVGDRVAGCFFPHWQDGRFSMDYHGAALGGSADGMLRERAVLPAHGVVKFAGHLSFEEAACLPCAGLTAWSALVESGGLVAGERVLVLGTGGVSVFALQIAVASGARVVVTSSSDAKLGRARELGAEGTVNYAATPDWDEAVMAATGGEGIDHVVEVGGPGTFPKSLRCLAPGGRLALIGVLTGKGAPETSLFPLVTKWAQIHGIYVGHRAAFERFNTFLASHALHPVIDRTFPFEEAAAAYEHLASGSHFGKVVVTVE